MADVSAFGEILWDIFETGNGTYQRLLGGAPANLCVVLARLGIRSTVVGGIGDDSFGKDLQNLLRKEKVDTSQVVTLPARTGITFVTRDRKGEPNFLFYRHETADMLVDELALPDRAGRAKFGVVGTSTLMNDPLWDATMAFVNQVRRAKGALVVDLNVRAHLWSSAERMRTEIADLVRLATIVKASEADLAVLAPRERRPLRWLRDHAPNATWLVTRGSAPATIRGPFGEIEVKTKKARVVDATGAGDSFLAGVLGTLVRSRAFVGTSAFENPDVWVHATRNGHDLARRAVGKVGAVTGVTQLASVVRKLEYRT